LPDENFQQTLLPHLDAAYNLARWILRDDAAAQDVVQEACLRALRYHDTLRGQQALPWLLQIVRNTAFTWIERARRDRQLESLPEDLPMPDASDPAAAMLEQLDVETLRRAVDNLPDEFREVIVLRELQGLSYKDIAAATGATLGTVMSRLSRARRRLQAALVPESPQQHPQEEPHGL
jgi:RNA polymerase sigma-70 factor (ECF subfamily)